MLSLSLSLSARVHTYIYSTYCIYAYIYMLIYIYAYTNTHTCTNAYVCLCIPYVLIYSICLYICASPQYIIFCVSSNDLPPLWSPFALNFLLYCQFLYSLSRFFHSVTSSVWRSKGYPIDIGPDIDRWHKDVDCDGGRREGRQQKMMEGDRPKRGKRGDEKSN